jgi:hypothetical protein
VNIESQGLWPDLFGGHVEIERMEKIYAGVDALSRKYAKHTVFLGIKFQGDEGQPAPHGARRRREA